MEDLRETVAALARRVQALEDELAIHRVIVRYGFAVDSGEAEGRLQRLIKVSNAA